MVDSEGDSVLWDRQEGRDCYDEANVDDLRRFFDRVESLSPGEVVDVEIELLPIGLAFHAGEQPRFVVGSRDLLGTLMPGIREYTGANKGVHVIHTGGERASCLRLPVLARWGVDPRTTVDQWHFRGRVPERIPPAAPPSGDRNPSALVSRPLSLERVNLCWWR